MSSMFINGAKYAVSTTLGASVAITAVSNANPGVAETETPPADNSIVVLTSGWPELNESIVRSASATADSFALAGVDTTKLSDFPAGEGTGSFQVAGNFVSLSQLRDVQMSGGEQQFFNWQYVEDKSKRQRQRPTYKNALSVAVIMDYDSKLPWYQAMIELDAAGDPVVLRETLPNGAVIYYYAYPSFNKVPTKTLNENITVTATFSLISDPIRYEAA